MDGLARNTSSLALLWGSIRGGGSLGFHSKNATLVDHRGILSIALPRTPPAGIRQLWVCARITRY